MVVDEHTKPLKKKKKLFVKLQPIQEHKNENVPISPRKCKRIGSTEDSPAFSYTQPVVTKNAFKKLEEIKKDIVQWNIQALKKSSSHENIQVVKKESCADNEKMVPEIEVPSDSSSSHEVSTAEGTSFSHDDVDWNEIDEGVLNENVQTMDEVPSDKNDQSVQEESSNKNIQSKDEEFLHESLDKTIQAEEEEYCHENVQTVEEGHSHKNDQSVQTKSSHGNVQIMEESSSYSNTEELYKNLLTVFQTIKNLFFHENVSTCKEILKEILSENIQNLEKQLSHKDDIIRLLSEKPYCKKKQEGSSHEKVQAVEESFSHSDIEEIRKNLLTILQTIRNHFFHENVKVSVEVPEDILNENVQNLEERLASKNDQLIQEKSCYGKNQTIQEKYSYKSDQDGQEGFSDENVQTMGEKFPRRNDQLVQEESSHENLQGGDGEFLREFLDKSIQTVEKKYSHETVEKDCSHRNEELAQEKSSHENVQAMEENSSHNNTEELRKNLLTILETIKNLFFRENFQTSKEVLKEILRENMQNLEKQLSRKNDQLIREKPHYKKNQPTRGEYSYEDDQDEQEGSSHGNVQVIRSYEESSHGNDPLVQKESFQKEPEKLLCKNNSDIENGSSDIHQIIEDQVAEVQIIQENKGCCIWLQKISVEPTMWLYMMAFMFTSVVEQAFFVHKACRVDHGYSEEICLHLNENKNIQTEVQKTVSEFQQWYNLAGHIIPIILALFFGNWSDRRGRKLPLVIGLIGKLIYSFMIVINSLMPNWNLNMVIYTAVVPMGLLGGDVIIFGSCFAYLTDICSYEERTMRITILDIVYLSTMPTGIALGSYVFANVVNSSYTIMFAINASLLILAIVYSLVRLKWQSSPEQQSLIGVNFLKDFFDTDHVRQTLSMMIKSRQNNARACLALVMLSMCLYTFQREERSMSYLYTQLVFNWDVVTFSYFRTFQSSFYVAAMLLAMPLMKHTRMKDTAITIVGAISHATGRLVFIAANRGELFYVGAVAAALGPVVAPALRSMASKYVLVEERGKVFAILSVFDNAVPLISSVLYSQIYNATIYTVPNFIYWLTFITQICVILLAIVISLAPWNTRAIRRLFYNNELLEST
ncbi:uncharacterized protein LOC105191424 isoform X2 [Harpegnathos saltator]|uniref:Solute carrier family 46 member 3 n=2 Tax=Harpegnathos saltator TaxID=610380 RepID=E2C9M6_HARSA|nr:uncharacterized protein LOC105191424 isoform X2 [Harpegnathos saltator]EFN75365.1 Solute carrier family 46 member 3 [Harpegnathos saltator]